MLPRLPLRSHARRAGIIDFVDRKILIKTRAAPAVV